MIQRNGKSNVLVIIPAFNEAGRISNVIHGIQAAAPEADILVIDDGSADATAYEADEAGAMVVSHPFNMGYGVTVQTGFKYARRHGYEYLVQMDGDGQHEPRNIPDLLAALRNSGTDVAMGSRWLGLAAYHGPLLRKFGKFFFGFMATLLTGHRVTDPTTGFQAMRRDVVSFFCTEVYPVDYPDANVIIMLNRAGFRVSEVPVVMYLNESGQSMHSGLLRPIFYGLKMMMSIGMTMLRRDSAVRDEASYA